MLAHLGAMLAHLGPMLAHLGAMPIFGAMLADLGGYVGPCWGYVGPSLGLCWPILGLCWPILGLCWPILGLFWPILGLCWPNLDAFSGLCWLMLTSRKMGEAKNIVKRVAFAWSEPARRQQGRNPLSPTDRRDCRTARTPRHSKTKCHMFVKQLTHHHHDVLFISYHPKPSNESHGKPDDPRPGTREATPPRPPEEHPSMAK